jgi:serine/threonine-protein kinase
VDPLMPVNEESQERKQTEPERIGRYELIFETSLDPVGGVWAARVVSGANEGKLVAARFIVPRPGLDSDFVQQVCEAAWSVMDLRLPAILAVIDVVVADGRALVVRDYLEGDTLRSLQRVLAAQKAVCGIPLAARIALDVLAAVSSVADVAAKQPDIAEFLFGGLSPDRVFLSSAGQVYFADLELLGPPVADAIRKLDTEILSYRAPEHLRQGAPLDARTDVFLAGMLVWELLAGRALFAARDEAVLTEALLGGSIARLDDAALGLAAPVSKGLADVLERALRRDPADRFSSVKEMRDALERASEGTVASAAQATEFVSKLVHKSWVERRRNVNEALARALSDKPPQQVPAAVREPTPQPRIIPPRPATAASKPAATPPALAEEPAVPSQGKPVGRINIKSRLDSRRPAPLGEAASPQPLLGSLALASPAVPKFDPAAMPQVTESRVEPAGIIEQQRQVGPTGEAVRAPSSAPLDFDNWMADAPESKDRTIDARSLLQPEKPKVDEVGALAVPVMSAPLVTPEIVEAKPPDPLGSGDNASTIGDVEGGAPAYRTDDDRVDAGIDAATLQAGRRRKMILVGVVSAIALIAVIIIALAAGGSSSRTPTPPKANTQSAPERFPAAEPTMQLQSPEPGATASAASSQASGASTPAPPESSKADDSKTPPKPTMVPIVPGTYVPIPPVVPSGKKPVFVPKGI